MFGAVRFSFAQSQPPSTNRQSDVSTSLDPSGEVLLPMTGQCRAIVEGYTKVLALDPADADAYEQRARARCYLGEYSEAIADYERNIRLGGKSAEVYRGRAVAKWLLHSKRTDPDGAMRDFLYALRVDDSERPLGIESAESFYLKRGRSEKERSADLAALADFNKALAANPENRHAGEAKAYMMRRLGDNRGAIETYSRLVEMDPGATRIYVSRGWAKVAVNDRMGALQDFDKAIDLEDDNALALIARADLKSKDLSDQVGAIEDYTRVISMEVRLMDAYMGRSDARRRNEDFDGAIEDADSALELSPESDQAYVLRGNAKDDAGDYEGALADYRKAMELSETNAAIYFNRGLVMLRFGDLNKALEDFEKAIQIDTAYSISYSCRGSIKFLRGDFTGALLDASRAIELKPFDCGLYVERACIKLAMGQTADALADFQASRASNPHVVPPRVLCYAMHASAGNWDKAETALQEVRAVLKTVASEEYPQTGRFIAGELTESQLLLQIPAPNGAVEAERQCEAHFAIGLRHMVGGQKDAAIENFQKAVDTGKRGLVYYQLAARNLTKLQK